MNQCDLFDLVKCVAGKLVNKHKVIPILKFFGYLITNHSIENLVTFRKQPNVNVLRFNLLFH